MFIKQSIFLRLAITFFLFISTNVGCLFNKPYKKSNIVGSTINDQDTSVEIREELDQDGKLTKKGFNHPYYFTKEGLSHIFSSIYYKERAFFAGEGKRKLFRHEELQKIIPPIINAFSMATDSQDILVFSTSHKVLLSDKQSYFSMFVLDNELHIVFSTIKRKKSYKDGRTYKLINKNKLKDPLDVKRRSSWNLIPMGGQRFAKGHHNWLIIDLSSDLYGIASNASINTNTIGTGSRIKAMEDRVITNRSFIKEKEKYQSVREKLRELKNLKDEGLISEKDFEEKKKDLLNEF
ncbi:MAG: SHOCT domain-containing protein [Candidatus Scalinduaceae bacterium]